MLNEHDIEQGVSKHFQENNRCLKWAADEAAKHFNKQEGIYIKPYFFVPVLESGVNRLNPIRTAEMETGFLEKPLSKKCLESEITTLTMFSHLETHFYFLKSSLVNIRTEYKRVTNQVQEVQAADV